MSYTSTATVATERPERYRKQLASHFGSKIEIREEPGGTVMLWGQGGTTTLTVTEGALVMVASAEDEDGLARVENVTGRHLIRFGEKDELTVDWRRSV
jgi:hypothetical protein